MNIIPGKNDIFSMAYIFPSKDSPVLLNDNTSIKSISAAQKSNTVPLIFNRVGGTAFTC